MIDPIDSQDRERRRGALIFGASVLIAAAIVLGRLLLGGAPDRGGRQSVPPVATVVFLTPAAPTAPATEVPATPPPAAQPVATPVTAPVATAEPQAAADEGELVGRVVCLDPGHGGADLGNVRIEDGEIALQEKDYTLAHALEIGRRLEARGATVVFTRTTDSEANPDNSDVNGDATVAAEGGEANSDQLDDLQARVNTCNGAGSELLVSVHYNGAENEALQGYEVWYNDDRPFSDLSARFATIIHEELGNAYEAAGYDANDRGIGIEDHAVTGPERTGKLAPSAMPGAVVEGLFLSNDEDAEFFRSEIAADTIIGAYEQAIVRYLEETGR